MTNDRSASVCMCISESINWMVWLSISTSHRASDCVNARRHLDGRLADAERIGRQLEVAEGTGRSRTRVVGAVHFADHIGMRHAAVLEDELRILIEAPATLVEHFADAQSRRIRRARETSRGLLNGCVRIGPRQHEKELRYAAVRDEALVAVQHPMVAVASAFSFNPDLGSSSGGKRLSPPRSAPCSRSREGTCRRQRKP